MPEVDAHEARIDAITAALTEKGRNLSRANAERLVRSLADPEIALSIADCARICGVSRPTAIRYRDFVREQLSTGADLTKNLGESTTDADLALEMAEIARRQKSAAGRAATRRPGGTREAVSAEDMQSIIDRALLRLDRENGPASQIKALGELKIRFEGLEAEGKDRVIDRAKTLGPAGVAGLGEAIRTRTSSFLSHRREAPEIYVGLATTVLGAVYEDRWNGDLPDALSKFWSDLRELDAQQELVPETEEEEDGEDLQSPTGLPESAVDTNEGPVSDGS